jgi:CRP-like cAMP-binding protein
LTPLVDLGRGDFFGEFAMLGSPHRKALVTAQSRVELLDVDLELFDQLSERSARFCRALGVACALRGRQNALARSGLALVLRDEDRTRLTEDLVERDLRPRELVVRAGDPIEQVYLVSEGRVEVYRREASGDKESLTVAGPGMFIPDPEVVTGDSYKLHARALEASRVYAVDRDLLDEISRSGPEIRARFVRLFSRIEAPPEAPSGSQTISVEHHKLDLTDEDLDQS